MLKYVANRKNENNNNLQYGSGNTESHKKKIKVSRAKPNCHFKTNASQYS